MPFLIGTDEAGYGPNLGPLTVTGTLWESPDTSTDLYSALEASIRQQSKGDGIFVADSKKVYSSGSIKALETSVLSLVYALHQRLPTSWFDLVEMICSPDSVKQLPNQVWLSKKSLQESSKDNFKFPLKADPDRIKELGQNFLVNCENAGVQLLALECVPVFPPQFNSQIEKLGNKATLLSSETLQIVSRLMTQTDDDLEIGCDKHGGRSKYGALIQQFLTDEFVMVGAESLEISDYSFRERDRDVVIRFQAKGESFLPTALASMVSKYLREIFMGLWNEFWKLKIPDIKPTKGYPVDAKRFKSEIAKVQAELGIADSLIWRNR